MPDLTSEGRQAREDVAAADVAAIHLVAATLRHLGRPGEQTAHAVSTAVGGLPLPRPVQLLITALAGQAANAIVLAARIGGMDPEELMRLVVADTESAAAALRESWAEG